MTRPAAWTQTPKGRRSVAAAIESRQRHRAAAQHLHRLLAQKRFKARARTPRNPVRMRSKVTARRDVRLKSVVAALMLDPANHRCSIRKEGV